MFSIGDKIVHPMHGAGIIQNIVPQTLDGKTVDYYALKLAIEDVLIYIPIDHCDEIGVRKVCSPKQATGIVSDFENIECDEEKCWNKRYRENMLRIRSGDILEVSKVVKNLKTRNDKRGLSTGEKKMFSSAKHILISELALSLSVPYMEIEKKF